MVHRLRQDWMALDGQHTSLSTPLTTHLIRPSQGMHASAAASYFWRRCGSGQAGRRWARRRSHVFPPQTTARTALSDTHER